MLHSRFSILLLRALFVLLTLLLAPSAARAQEPTGGVIEGTVTMASGAPLPADLQAELLFLPNQQGPPRITPQPLGADGSFRFEVDPDPAHLYFVRVRLEGNSNVSEPITFAPGETTKRIALALVERTTDASALALAEINYILDPVSDGWLVVGLYRYENGGEIEILNTAAPPAAIPLPAGASNVRFATDLPTDAIVETEGGFSYGGPFPPGVTPFIFSFSLPYERDGQTIELPLSADAAYARVLLPETIEVAVTGLEATGAQEGPEGRLFARFESETIPADGTVRLALSTLPPLPTPNPTDLLPADPNAPEPRVVPISPLERLPRWAPLVPAALALLGVGLYLARRPAPTRAEQRAGQRARRERLVAEIAALDIRHESGGVGPTTYQRQRAALVHDLKGLLREDAGDEVTG